MRRSQRLIAAAVVIALSGALAGCSSSLSNFDPSDLLDFLDTKKKLPGERKPVFPDGVPGLEQGVPKELYKGSPAGADRPAERRRGGCCGSAARAGTGAEGQAIEGQGNACDGRHRACGCTRRDRRRSGCRAGGRGRHCRRSAGAQAQEDRAQAHHRAAARSDRPAGRATSCTGATIRRTVPGTDASRHLHALRFRFHLDSTPAS